MEKFELNANKIQHFLLNYLKQFETILLFIRSTRQNDLLLHLESIESLTKYFFAHDHLNYVRLLPLYKLSRVINHASKLSAVFREHGDPFVEEEAGDELYNLLTKEVIDEKVSRDILERDKIGQQMFQQFVADRIVDGKLSVWDKMTKAKLQTFKSSNASAELRSGDKFMKVKEERGLLQRFAVISRSRPELDLKSCISSYELGVVPRSLFASNGSLLLAYDKAKILHQLEHLKNHEESLADDSVASDS